MVCDIECETGVYNLWNSKTILDLGPCKLVAGWVPLKKRKMKYWNINLGNVIEKKQMNEADIFKHVIMSGRLLSCILVEDLLDSVKIFIGAIEYFQGSLYHNMNHAERILAKLSNHWWSNGGHYGYCCGENIQCARCECEKIYTSAIIVDEYRKESQPVSEFCAMLLCTRNKNFSNMQDRIDYYESLTFEKKITLKRKIEEWLVY